MAEHETTATSGMKPVPVSEIGVEKQIEALDLHGYVVIEDVLNGTEMAVLRGALAPYLTGSMGGRNDFEGFHTARVYALLAKSAEFARIVDHPTVAPILMRLWDPNDRVGAARAINLHRGCSALIAERLVFCHS